MLISKKSVTSLLVQSEPNEGGIAVLGDTAAEDMTVSFGAAGPLA